MPSIRIPTGVIPLTWGETPARSDRGVAALQRAAMEWSYIVRNRHRWAGRETLVADQAKEARQLLNSFNVADAALRDIAKAGVAQVVVPYQKEAIGWEGRLFPWEFVISAATRPMRHGEPLAILRQLELSRSPKRLTSRAPKSVLYVESTPGPLTKEYSFDSERELARANLSGDSIKWHEVKNPTRQKLRELVTKLQPDVIHVAGFDTHQGMRLIGASTEDPIDSADPDGSTTDRAEARVDDGYLMADDEQRFVSVGVAELASILCAGASKPLLVSCSLWNSARRVCPMLIAEGASTAIGFQDSFDDELVEAFFASFYRSWRDATWDLRTGFLAAWDRIRVHPVGLIGTGLVLWSEMALVGAGTERPAKERADYVRVQKAREKSAHQTLDPAAERVEAVLKPDVKPMEELNYSLLHNKRPLFESFKLIKLKPGRMTNVAVTADLNAGAFSFPYRRLYDFPGEKGDILDLTREIHASLTADLARSVRESVNTSLFVEVSWNDQLLYRDTHRVRLLPADQWRDTDEDRIWLPCFVLPRDPAVESIVTKAHRYVRVLRDDPAAGFDGYQSVDSDREDPTEDVDLQVQAIWAAIMHEWQLGYINPPPSYSKGQDSQRLRTPSAIIAERSGTCIDLALLFAGCLELVDIYPVIFLLKAHAFPGYWRSDTAHEEFLKVRKSGGMSAGARRMLAVGTQPEPWVSGAVAYDEIVQQIDQGHLVPIESVKLTENCGFWGAVEAGKENMRPRREFDSMLDILSARRVCVTPLPISDSRL